MWEGKPRAESNSKAGVVVALQARAQSKKSRVGLMLVNSPAVITSPVITRQVHSDQIGLKSNR